MSGGHLIISYNLSDDSLPVNSTLYSDYKLLNITYWLDAYQVKQILITNCLSYIKPI